MEGGKAVAVRQTDLASYYARNPRAVALISGRHTLWSLSGEPVLRSADVPSTTVASLWERLATPIDGSDLAAHVAADRDPAALEGLLDRLIAGAFVLRGAVDEVSHSRGERPMSAPGTLPLPCGHLVLGVTGAVQAAFVAPLIRRLAIDFAARIDVILTRSARRFITPDAAAALGATVWRDPFERRAGFRVPHTELAEGAGLILVLPASADSIFRLAHGSCSDLLSLVVAGTRAPVVVAPSMSSVMWSHPAVRRNVARLREDGAYVIEPGPGRSVASDATCTVGGLGLGGDSANLLDVLRAVLDLSR